MARQRHSLQNIYIAQPKRQKGMALLMLAFILGLAVTATIIKSMNSNTVRAAQEKNTARVLADAKAALVAWAVNHPNVPGMLPYPDRNNDAGRYDGLSDCPGGATNYSHLIGQLPWKAGDYNDCNTLISGLGYEFKDSSGEHLWYAVSRNLVHNYSPTSDPIINPGIIDAPTYPWMIVLDKHGNVVSNRVAAVIIAPGGSIGDQDRSGGIAGASEYLDNFKIGTSIYSNTGYTMPDEDWVMGEDMRSVPDSDATYEHPYYFNDKLIYITIDELMAAVEKRAAGELSKALTAYKSNISHPYFPYAAPLGSSNSYSCQDSNLKGMLPVTAGGSTVTCSCASSTNCTCNFGSITSVSYKRSGSSTWSASNISGLCTRPSSQTCTCTGAGFCKNTSGSINFTCDSAGNCTTNTTGTYTFAGAFKTATVTTSTGSCSYSCGSSTVTCNGSGSFSSPSCSIPTFTGFPAWITTNKWQDYFYYELSSNCTSTNHANCSTATPQLTVGLKTGVQSLLVSTGKSITSPPYASKGSAQSRPSCSINDYLDSAENTDGNLVYDARNTPRTSSYNDQIFIVSP